MNNFSKKLIGWLLKVGISAGILWYILSIVPFSNIMASLKTADLRWCLLAVLCVLLFAYCHAFRMQILTVSQGMSLSVIQIFNIGLAANFYSLFIPGGILSGGPIRWYKLSRPDKKPAQALVSIVYNRIIHITSIAAIGLLFWVLDPSLKKSSGAGLILVGAATLLIGFYLLILNKRVSSFFEKVFERPHFIPFWIREKTKKILGSARQTHNLSPKSWCSVWILSFVGDAFGIYAFYLLSLALQMEVSWIHLAWIRSVLILLTMLPISISGIGIREGGLVVLLAPFGIEATSSVAYAFLLFTVMVVIAGLGGLIEAKSFLFPDKSNPQIREVSES